MRYSIVSIVLILVSVLEIKAEADPKFHIYLCFGQSNMEGALPPEAVDLEYVDDRFQTLASVNFSSPYREKGKWYTAYPPIVRENTGLGMADYFGRTMVAALPVDYRVGVVDVAIGGVGIKAFMSEEASNYTWIMPSAFAAYGNNPYTRLVEMAKIAQKSGVIKGILMHQGEADSGQNDWPQWVNIIYKRLLSDLELDAMEVPLLVGELVNASEGGACADHNSLIAQLPTIIPTAHVVSSVGCPCSPDYMHFSLEGYRIMGSRYATTMLSLLSIPDEPEPVVDYQFSRDGINYLKTSEGEVEVISADEGVTELIIPETVVNENVTYSVTSIANNAFYLSGGITSVNIPGSVKTIGTSVFEDCTGLTSVSLSEGIETIGGSSFAGCSGISEIFLPSSITTIGINGFKNCCGLTSIVSLNNNPPLCNNPFEEVDKENCIVWVTEGCKEAYKDADEWKDFINIREILDGDVNSDGKVNEADVNAIVSHIMGNTPEGFSIEKADLTGDGNINVTDITILIKKKWLPQKRKIPNKRTNFCKRVLIIIKIQQS